MPVRSIKTSQSLFHPCKENKIREYEAPITVFHPWHFFVFCCKMKENGKRIGAITGIHQFIDVLFSL